MFKKFFIFVLFLFLMTSFVLAYENTKAGRLEWFEDSVPILLSHQKSVNYGLSDEFGNSWSISGGAKAGESINYSSHTDCEVSSDCLEFVYNFSARSGYAILNRQSSSIIDGRNFSAIGFWYKGDGSDNYIGQLKLWNNATGSDQAYNTVSLPATGRLYLDSTDWRYAIFDLSYVKNNTVGTSGNNIDFNQLSQTKGLSFVLFDESEDYPEGVVYFDNYSLIDLDYGSMDYFRWLDQSELVRNGRYNEGVISLAFAYSNPDSVYYQNDTILNATFDALDWYVQNQLFDGGWSEVGGDGFGHIQSTPASVGFPALSIASSYDLLKDNARIDENVTLFFEDNFYTAPRSWFYEETLRNSADFSLNNITMNRTYYTEYANQELIAFLIEWYYGNLTGNQTYLNDFDVKLNWLNSSRLTPYNFLIEANTTDNIGFDASYNSVQDQILAVANDLTHNSMIDYLFSRKDLLVPNIMDETNKVNVPYGSRGTNISSSSRSWSLIYNESLDLGYENMAQMYYYFGQDWDDYGDYQELYARNQFRGVAFSYYDYLNYADLVDLGVRFPMNLSYKDVYIYSEDGNDSFYFNYSESYISQRKGNQWMYIFNNDSYEDKSFVQRFIEYYEDYIFYFTDYVGGYLNFYGLKNPLIYTNLTNKILTVSDLSLIGDNLNLSNNSFYVLNDFRVIENETREKDPFEIEYVSKYGRKVDNTLNSSVFVNVSFDSFYKTFTLSYPNFSTVDFVVENRNNYEVGFIDGNHYFYAPRYTKTRVLTDDFNYIGYNDGLCSNSMVPYKYSQESGCSGYVGEDCLELAETMTNQYDYNLLYEDYNENAPIWSDSQHSCLFKGVRYNDASDVILIQAWRVNANGGQFCTIQNEWNWYIYRYDPDYVNDNLTDPSYRDDLPYYDFPCDLSDNVIDGDTGNRNIWRKAFIWDFSQNIYIVLLIIWILIIVVLCWFRLFTYAAVLALFLAFVFLFSGINILWFILTLIGGIFLLLVRTIKF